MNTIFNFQPSNQGSCIKIKQGKKAIDDGGDGPELVGMGRFFKRGLNPSISLENQTYGSRGGRFQMESLILDSERDLRWKVNGRIRSNRQIRPIFLLTLGDLQKGSGE